MTLNKRILFGLLVSLATFSLITPIAQDLSYHTFADQTHFCNLTNGMNVLSNVPYFIIGAIGLIKLFSAPKSSRNTLKMSLAISLILVALGSGYYHLAPSNATLLWDRLAMSTCFAALLTLVCYELNSANNTANLNPIASVWKLGLALLVACLGSVLYWYWSELNNLGDLRAYALIQFGGILFIIISLFRLSGNTQRAFFILIIGYILAKICEHFDQQIYDVLNQTISGHSLKHIISGLALAPLVIGYQDN
ncbi:ceramidase domain-containing protein [Catenovulum maritimum]|uniref:Alkaline phytoceramidase n=1 Tax=Catenovulum maritimum TaxID=1513271 RepID=A0A0J8GTE6_9ALTE|nr:hypothetical protein [Catenovulum maritimum]KMT66007.1 hypothetical protein XM47_06025 [Catenovulum maritimum]